MYVTARSRKTLLPLALLALVLALQAVGFTSPAHAQGNARIWTNQGQYRVGESIQVCYSVPGPGPFRIIDILADGRSQTFFSGTDDGRGGCVSGQITEPAGTERMRLEVLRNGSVIASADTSFQVLAVATVQAQANAQPVQPPQPAQPQPAQPQPIVCAAAVAAPPADAELDGTDTNNEDSEDGGTAVASVAAVPGGPVGGCGGRSRSAAIMGAINRANRTQADALRRLDPSNLSSIFLGDAYYQMAGQVESFAWASQRLDCQYLGVRFRDVHPGFTTASAQTSERWSCNTYDAWTGRLLDSTYMVTFNTYELVRQGRFWYVSRVQTVPV